MARNYPRLENAQDAGIDGIDDFADEERALVLRTGSAFLVIFTLNEPVERGTCAFKALKGRFSCQSSIILSYGASNEKHCTIITCSSQRA